MPKEAVKRDRYVVRFQNSMWRYLTEKATATGTTTGDYTSHLIDKCLCEQGAAKVVRVDPAMEFFIPSRSRMAQEKASPQMTIYISRNASEVAKRISLETGYSSIRDVFLLVFLNSEEGTAFKKKQGF